MKTLLLVDDEETFRQVLARSMRRLKRQHPECDIVVLTGCANIANAVEAVKLRRRRLSDQAG